jgi:tetratricopeptide (TPR) repeat protein
MAVVYQNILNYKKALNYYEKSLEIMKMNFGENHPSIASSLNNIAMVYQKIGDNKKAIEYFEKSLKMKINFLGKSIQL